MELSEAKHAVSGSAKAWRQCSGHGTFRADVIRKQGAWRTQRWDYIVDREGMIAFAARGGLNTIGELVIRL